MSWSDGMVGGRLSEDHCARVVDHIDQEILLADAGGRVVFANDAAKGSIGDDIEGLPLSDIFRSDENGFRGRLRSMAQTGQWMPFNAKLARGSMEGAELRLRGRGYRDRQSGRLELLMVADRSRDDGFRQLRQLIRDLNKELAGKRRANIRLSESLEAESRLHRELIHRVKNNLGLLSAMVSFRKKASKEDSVKQALGDLEHRIYAISAVHDLLDQAGEIDEVQAGELIRALCHQLKNSVLPENIEIENELLDVTLSVQDATPLSLLVNELITNSAKHAFDGREQGKVTVSLKKNGVDKLEVNIADNGSGFPARPKRVGSGSRIIKALAQQIGGELERHDDGEGTRWTFIFPHREAKKSSTGLAGDNDPLRSEDT